MTGSGPLAGVRIVELVGIGPAPFAAMMLADMGAEVLRIHPVKARGTVGNLNSASDVLARNRLSIGLDLKSDAGRACLLDLVSQADGMMEGFRPGVMERLGLGPDICLERNPALVFGRMTGWGQDGPLAPRAGHDINYIALTGILNGLGTPEKPVVPLNLIGDFGGGGMLLAFGMVCAILSARTSGRGQVVDAAMVDGAAALSAMIHGMRAGGWWPGGRAENMLDGGAFYYGVYACADGRHLAIGAIEPQFLATLLTTLGLDPADFQPQDDRSLWPGFRARLEEIIASRTRDEWATIFEGLDACVSPILDWDEAMDHPHNRARGTFIEVEGVPQPAPAPRFSGTPAAPPRPPSPPDRDPDQALAGWGIDADRVRSLIADGALKGPASSE
ncbi:CaiB/BaiF CoA transferase family protein [Amorphus orientalis]|uniref:Alpha-methylacyl-CoA racemase n=1 Tax=Amorphus orientalis TaxID=649198 RepID=A0AAE3VNQ3_9HYPH|nr:CaiB/BaiF CoA-transferase family protein [Amorphus orientalis]MDQ0315391.1 alpha-methylacyl-CoA racemase [Amorphus orientalis]